VSPARVASDFYAAFAPWRLRPRLTNYTHNCRTYTAHRLSLLLRFLAAAIRTLVDPADPNDMKTAHAPQVAIKV
jgi:hypothetical protein